MNFPADTEEIRKDLRRDTFGMCSAALSNRFMTRRFCFGWLTRTLCLHFLVYHKQESSHDLVTHINFTEGIQLY